MATRKGIKHFQELQRTPYITCLIHRCTLYLKKNERSDKIVFYIIFKSSRPSDAVFQFRVKSNSSQRLYVRVEFLKIEIQHKTLLRIINTIKGLFSHFNFRPLRSSPIY